VNSNGGRPGSGLSDIAVSPLGFPMALLREEVRVAVLGRTSTEEQQDPRQSLIRQICACRTALPESWVVVGHFYDVESGRMALSERGRGTDVHEKFGIPVPRDGGITDLLEEAASPNRRFDVVICESISRVARRAFEGLSVERELERNDVVLFAANEPITVSGGRAQRILQRRINQAIAEYEVVQTLELSWGGLCTHVRDGWNIGKPPYGYRALDYRHPNPAKAAKGQTKMRLEPDPATAPTVTQIAAWRYYDGIGYAAIAERLNADLERFPPPTPPGGRRARGAWGKSSVYEILKNPKYTGYQVFNRRATRSARGKVNDPMKWVWSTEPTHEPLIAKWMYDEIQARRPRRSARVEEANPHRQTDRTYLLRGLTRCWCGRRMHGSQRRTRTQPHGYTYYQCWPRTNNRGRAEQHHKATYLREDAVLDAIARFYASRVFGPDRAAALTADLATVDDRAAADQQSQRERLQRTIADLTRRQTTLLRQAQDIADPEDPWVTGLRNSYNDLEAEKTAALNAVADLDAVTPTSTGPGDVTLLDHLPQLRLDLTDAPAPLLRALFDATRLAINLHEDSDDVTLTVTLPAGDLPAVGAAARELAADQGEPDAVFVDVVRAPGGIRTHTGRCLRALSLPVGLQGRVGGTHRRGA
jgi:site-specific DNA recombinase